jgi:pilus biogenesis lipoprotein CpaD
MKKLKFESIVTLGSLPVIMLLTLGLAACSVPEVDSQYDVRHENVVGAETLSMEITGAVGRELSSVAFTRILREFHNRARGAIAIEVRRFDQSDEQVSNNIGLIVKALRSAGVHASQIIVLPTPPENNLNAVISFTANTVKVPECGAWEKSSAFNWSNTPHENFGCATQRNFGLMVANPGDLKKSQTLSILPNYLTGGSADTGDEAEAEAEAEE